MTSAPWPGRPPPTSRSRSATGSAASSRAWSPAIRRASRASARSRASRTSPSTRASPADRDRSPVDRGVPALRGEAVERARALMRPELGGGEADRGYVDLIGGELVSTGATQDLMLTRLVPAIYERWWRPALGQVAKGLTGPGMAEEVRIARLLLGLGSGDTVLDLACGPGNFSREFARAVRERGLVVVV